LQALIVFYQTLYLKPAVTYLEVSLVGVVIVQEVDFAAFAD
jgi:hypothetical protein